MEKALSLDSCINFHQKSFIATVKQSWMQQIGVYQSMKSRLGLASDASIVKTVSWYEAGIIIFS